MSTTPDELESACGEPAGGLCKAVLEATDNEDLARVADWAIGRPLKVLFILLVAWILARVARRAVQRLVYRVVAADNTTAKKALERVGYEPPDEGLSRRREARAQSLSTVLASTAVVGIWAVALMMIIGELGINLGPLIASAGIAGVALGFGAQSVVRDCLAGTFMLIEDQYGIGDIVDLGEAQGTVERISLRTTVLRSQDGTVWHVPNGEVRRVGNRSQQWSVAVLDVTVGPTADVTRATDIIERTSRDVCGAPELADVVLDEPRVLGVESIRADGVTIRLLVTTTPGSQFALQRALREAISRALADAGVPAPPLYPTPMSGPPPVA
jgi:small-conductance mechanosensitive channel